jgi:hypothetical protein
MKSNKKEEPSLEAEYNPAEEMPSKLEHFPIYAKYARKNKLPVKCPTEDHYPKMKVRFQRFDQPQNVLKCRIRNKDIDWQGQLIPGCVYELCMPVIQWLTSISEPVYAEVKVKHDAGGGKYVEKTETRQVSERARFSCQPLEFSFKQG